jgi:hypothetical protein
LIDLFFTGNEVEANLEIVYDGDDAGAGQFTDPDFGLRSPDNLDWASNGKIYIQEDRSTTPDGLFGAASGREASIWELDPYTGKLVRISEMNRAAVPFNQQDPRPSDIGNWESSGVIDVTSLFHTKPGELLLLVNVQAHSLAGRPLGGAQQSSELVQGGQLLFVSNRNAGGVNRRENPHEALTLARNGGTLSAEGLPTEFAVRPVYPNPFNPATTVTFQLPETAPVELVIFNTLGQKVKTLAAGMKPAGYHTLKWDATNENGAAVASGVYYLQVRAGAQQFRQKMVLMR